MKTLDWAEREVQLACKKENPDRKPDEFDYGCGCYESALRIYNSINEILSDEGHSGMSASYTMAIVNRLMGHKVLTPIEDTPDIWEECTDLGDSEKRSYRCIRMSSLFKDEYNDGTIEYNDVRRTVCYNEDDPHKIPWHNGSASKLINEMYPITFPYMPPDSPYKVFMNEYLTDEKNGDFDTIHFVRVLLPSGEEVMIDRFFGETDDGWKELNYKEFEDRYILDFKRKQKEKENQNGIN